MARSAALAGPGAGRTAVGDEGQVRLPGSCCWHQLNKKKKRYKAVVVQPEFDFEAPADANGVPGDGPGGGTGMLANAEVNGRLTMRDVILARVGAGVQTSNPQSGHFSHLLVEKVAGSTEVTVTRGWTSVDAKVRGSRQFHFVNTHLEAFDNAAEYPSIRAQQASELVAPGGPATSKLPVILVGDLNSDVKTEVQPGDGQAYRVMKQAGFRERATDKPNGCCIDSLAAQHRQRSRHEPQGRPHHDQRPEAGEAAEVRRHRAQDEPRPLGLRPRRPLQRTEAPALSPAADGPISRQSPGNRPVGRELSGALLGGAPFVCILRGICHTGT